MLRISEHCHYYLSQEEHFSLLSKVEDGLYVSQFNSSPLPILFDSDENKICLQINISGETAKIENSYYIGLDWIHPWKMPVMVEPKVNNEHFKLNHLQMLMDALKEPENLDHLDGLMDIRFEDEWIEVIGESSIELSPFLIVQFLMAVKSIVRKGLKKDYYRVKENLTSKVKGKILVGQQIRQNIVRSNLTKAVCEFQDYGINTEANKFLKYVLKFVQVNLESSINKNDSLIETLNFNLGAFSQVSNKQFYSFEKKESNPFFREYNEAIRIGNQLLKLLDHNLSKATTDIQKYPPHWIDMSKLFELYVFKKLRERYSGVNEVQYHFKTHYQELDFIINTPERKAVVDAKYKPRYKAGNPSKDDARQLAGYARLNSVYRELGIEEQQMIDIYFVYPSELKDGIISTDENLDEDFELTSDKDDLAILPKAIRVSKAYRRMFLQEVELPVS
jgi:5-methylcytosine-specific restriction enzyme subunit McrC